jgi:HEPN domain-containing protein
MSVKEAERWLGYARSDLAAAEALAASPDHYPRQVCFLAQQAAEKTLKAALIAQEIEFPFTHDLDRLRNLLSDQWAVKKAFPDLAEMTIWAVEARYPADMPEVLESDAKRALKVARAIISHVEDDLAQLSLPPEDAH